MSRPQAQPQFSRTALAPGILAAIVLLAGFALIGTSWFLYLRYAVCILALIMCVFAGQAKQWWWYAALVPIAVLYNPVWPVALPDVPLRIVQLVAAAALVAAGISIKTPADTRR